MNLPGETARKAVYPRAIENTSNAVCRIPDCEDSPLGATRVESSASRAEADIRLCVPPGCSPHTFRKIRLR